MTDSLLTSEALAMIGASESGGVDIIARDFQRWAAAVGDRNRLYFDAEYARAHGHPDVVMPPLFLSTRLMSITDLDNLRPDGIPNSMDHAMPLPPRRMAGSEEWNFHAPAYGGDVIHWRRELVDLEEKAGRSGPFVAITWVTTYRKAPDILVALNINSLLALPLKGEG